MIKKSIFLAIISVVLYSESSFAQDPLLLLSDAPQEAIQVAQERFQRLTNQLEEKDFADWNIANREDFDLMVIGPGFSEIAFLEEIDYYNPQKAIQYLEQTERWLFPVVLRNKIAFFVGVYNNGDEYLCYSIGAGRLANKINLVLEKMGPRAYERNMTIFIGYSTGFVGLIPQEYFYEEAFDESDSYELPYWEIGFEENANVEEKTLNVLNDQTYDVIMNNSGVAR